MGAKSAEVEAVRADMEAQKTELGRLCHENSILKQGIRIQHAAVERTRAECEHRQAEERAAFVQAGMQAAEQIRRLEQANYALRVQLEQMSPSSFDCSSFPRWGEGH